MIKALRNSWKAIVWCLFFYFSAALLVKGGCNIFLSILLVIFVFLFSSLIHEIGHWAMAKVFGVKTYEISVSFKPFVFKIRMGIQQIDFRIAMIAMAGPATNILIGIISLSFLFFLSSVLWIKFLFYYIYFLNICFSLGMLAPYKISESLFSDGKWVEIFIRADYKKRQKLIIGLIYFSLMIASWTSLLFVYFLKP